MSSGEGPHEGETKGHTFRPQSHACCSAARRRRHFGRDPRPSMQQQVPDELPAVSIASGRPLDGRLGPAIEMNKHTYLTALSGGWRSHTAMRQQASVVGYWFQVCSKPHEVIWVESISVVPSMVRSRSRVAGCQHQQMFGWGWVWGQCSKNPRVKSLSSCIFIVTVWVDLQVGSVWDFYC